MSSSHVSQFLKALQQGCKSPEDSLVDPRTGRMNMSSFRDNEMLTACSDCWVWYMSFLGMWKLLSLFIHIILHDFGFYTCIHVLS